MSSEEDLCTILESKCKAHVYSCEYRSFTDTYEALIDFKDSEHQFIECYKILSRANIAIITQPHPLGIKIYAQKIKLRRVKSYNIIALVLFVATLASVFWTGMLMAQNNLELLRDLGLDVGKYSQYLWATTYAVSIMGILGLHEIGHIIASSRCIGTWNPPMFIPAPGFGLGTFGAIVTSRFRPSTPTCLALLGISGPALGFLASMVVLIIGSMTSIYVSPELVPPEEALRSIPLAALISWLIVSGAEGKVMIPNAAAFAGVIMLYIHFLNLLPIGQLDGGHVVTSVLGPRFSKYVSLATMIAILIYAALYPVDLILIAAMFTLLAFILTGLRPHPGPACSLYESRSKRALIFIIYTLILSLSTPIPSI